jgi:hypothetical protein
MKENTLLGEIGLKFVKQTENLATESLNFILGKSSKSKDGFNELIRQLNSDIDAVNYSTQVFDLNDTAIPDIIGTNPDNQTTVIIEAKFWAGLTKNQPVTYLERLPENVTAILVFLIPEKRVSEVWSEIQNRLSKHSKYSKFFEENRVPNLQRFGTLNKYHSIGIITWRQALQALKSKVDQSAEASIMSDINQLKGLCQKIDSLSFIPLAEGELTPIVARRNMDYCDLVDEIVDYGKEMKTISTEGLRAAAKKYTYHRYFRFKGWNCSLSFDNDSWCNYANTPIWLEVFGKGKNQWEDVSVFNDITHKLQHLEGTTPKKLIINPSSPPLLPLYLKENETKSALIENIYTQALDVINIII